MSLPRNPIRRNVPPYRPPGVPIIPGEYRPAPDPTPPARGQRLQIRPGVDGLVLLIAGQGYQVQPIPREPGGAASVLVRLTRADGTVYHVARLDARCDCDCPDHAWRAEAEGRDCKHVVHLARWGLLGPRPPLAGPRAEGWGAEAEERVGLDPDHFDGSAEGDPYDRTPAELAGARTG
jgi:hypothetical protein